MLYISHHTEVLMLQLAQNLKKYRLSQNLTQEELANFLNITPQSVSKWERGVSPR